MENTPDNQEDNNLRKEPRILTGSSGSVEFIPGNNDIPYHFKLRDFSSSGFGIWVRRDSKVLRHIKPGIVLDMRYHPEDATANPVVHKTQIKHISEPEPGKQKDHMLVGLMVID